MKITKRQLQRIIKEELSAVLGEDVNELALRQDSPQKGSLAKLNSAVIRWVKDPRAKEHRSPQSVPAWREEACAAIKAERERLAGEESHRSGPNRWGDESDAIWESDVQVAMEDAEILGCVEGE
tara:strand:+ start:1092 stop:1463 length:372 start_codon:yes stop_codon:yes gene_type:complete